MVCSTPRLTASDKGGNDRHCVGRSAPQVREHYSDAPTPSPFAGSGRFDRPLESHFPLGQSHREPTSALGSVDAGPARLALLGFRGFAATSPTELST